MDWGRKGKMDLGMEETDLRVLTQAGEQEAWRNYGMWLYSLAFPQCPGVGRSWLELPCPSRWQCCFPRQDRAGQVD